MRHGRTAPRRRKIKLSNYKKTPTQNDPPVASTDLFGIGQRIEFTGYMAASFSYAVLRIGDTGNIHSVKRPDQIGMDYAVTMDSGQRVMLNHNEVKSEPNVKEHAPPLAGASVETGGEG